jgi:hypothetical protein
MFHQCFPEHRFLDQLWSCYSSFIFKSNLLHLLIRYFLGINQSFLSFVFDVEKNTPTELIGKLLSMAPMAICHHLKILSSIPPVNDVPLIFKNMAVLFTSTKNYSTSKTLSDNAIYKIDGDDADELFHSKN